MRWRLMRISVVICFILGPTAFSHHSVSAEFDVNKPIEFTGTVKEVQWTNPHIYTVVEVKQTDGATRLYKIEGSAPNSLFRSGWRKTLKIGDVVSVKGNLAKNPESINIGQATILTKDGKRVFSGQNPTP